MSIYFSGANFNGMTTIIEIPVDFEAPITNIGTPENILDTTAALTGVVVMDTAFSGASVYYGINNYAGEVVLTGSQNALSASFS